MNYIIKSAQKQTAQTGGFYPRHPNATMNISTLSLREDGGFI
jgi:hypothetical protein